MKRFAYLTVIGAVLSIACNSNTNTRNAVGLANRPVLADQNTPYIPFPPAIGNASLQSNNGTVQWGQAPSPLSPTIPNTIAKGAIGWWDASDNGVTNALWKDKTGNGHDWTSSGALLPTVVTGLQGGRTAMRFGGTQVMTTGAWTVQPPFTIWVFGKQTGGGVGYQFVITLNGANLTFRDPGGFMAYYEGVNEVSSNIVPTSPTSNQVSVANYGSNIGFRSFGSTVLATSPGTGNQYVAGPLLGSDSATASSNTLTGDIYEIAVWNRVLTPIENVQNDLYAANKYQLAPTTDLLIVDGNSFVNGTGATGPNYFLGKQTLNLLGTSYGSTYIQNGGLFTPQMIAGAPTTTDPYAERGLRIKTVVLAIDGTDDIVFNHASAQVAFNNTVTYCQNRHTAGHYCVVPSLISRSDGGTPPNYNTIRKYYNNLIRTNWPTFADGFADWASDPIMGIDGAETNTTVFNGDLVHPNNNGYQILAGYLASSVWALGIP